MSAITGFNWDRIFLDDVSEWTGPPGDEMEFGPDAPHCSGNSVMAICFRDQTTRTRSNQATRIKSRTTRGDERMKHRWAVMLRGWSLSVAAGGALGLATGTHHPRAAYWVLGVGLIASAVFGGFEFDW